MNKITSKVYDKHIIQQGIQLQIDTYYEPKEISMRRRIKIVMEAIDPKPKEKILDIGCGVGTFAFHCAKLKAISFGMDYSEESIRVALDLSKRYGVIQNTKFIVGDAIKLPFKDFYFDKVVAADFIEHVTFEEKEELLKEICRVLNPEGKIIIFTPNGIREKIGDIYWKVRHGLSGNTIPKTDLHFGLTDKTSFEKICKRNRLSFNLFYRDVTRPYLAWMPFIRRFLALNLLWVIRRDRTDNRLKSGNEIGKVLVVNLGGIGDILLSIPALRALRDFYSDAKIFMLVTPLGYELVSSLPYINDAYILYTRYQWKATLAVVIKNLKTLYVLRRRNFDLAVNMRTIVSKPGAFKIRILLNIINPEFKVGRDTEGRGSFFDVRIPERDFGEKYEMDYDIEMARALGADITDKSLNFEINEGNFRKINKALKNEDILPEDILIGIHPGGEPSRRWPVERFSDVVNKISKRIKCKFVITGGREEVYLADKLIGMTDARIINMAGKISIKELGALIKRCSLYISNDTGPMHIAAVLKTPLVAIFGPGDIIRYDPRNISGKAVVLYRKVDCAPCNRLTCKSLECLKAVSPEEVVEAALKCLQKSITGFTD